MQMALGDRFTVLTSMVFWSNYSLRRIKAQSNVVLLSLLRDSLRPLRPGTPSLQTRSNGSAQSRSRTKRCKYFSTSPGSIVSGFRQKTQMLKYRSTGILKWWRDWVWTKHQSSPHLGRHSTMLSRWTPALGVPNSFAFGVLARLGFVSWNARALVPHDAISFHRKQNCF